MCGRNGSFRTKGAGDVAGGKGSARSGFRAHTGGRCRNCTCADREAAPAPGAAEQPEAGLARAVPSAIVLASVGAALAR